MFQIRLVRSSLSDIRWCRFCDMSFWTCSKRNKILICSKILHRQHFWARFFLNHKYSSRSVHIWGLFAENSSLVRVYPNLEYIPKYYISDSPWGNIQLVWLGYTPSRDIPAPDSSFQRKDLRNEQFSMITCCLKNLDQKYCLLKDFRAN